MTSNQRHCSKCRNYVACELFLQKNSVVGDGRFFKSCAPCRAKSSTKNVEKNGQTNNELKNCSNCGNHVAKELFRKDSVVGFDQFFSMCAPCRVKSSACKKAWREKEHQINDDPPTNKRKILVESDPDVQTKRLRTGSTSLKSI
jgi:hypothetical protein